MVFMPLAIESSRLPRSLARLLRPCAEKKLIGLSRAVLTRLPVASLVWVDVIRSEVFCSCRRFDRTPAVRTISDIVLNLSGLFPQKRSVTRDDPHWIKACDRMAKVIRRKNTWLTGSAIPYD